jgi:predicted amino acid-binding ACT domain protein
MTNIELIQIEILNQIISQIDHSDLEEARNTAVRFRDKLQEDVDKAESDIDIQLQLETESKYGK